MTELTEEERNFFEEQIRMMYRELYAAAVDGTGSVPDAEDLLQTVCAEAWRSFSSLKDRKKFRSWIRGILRHRLNDYYRRKYREKENQTITSDPEGELSDSPSFLTSELVVRDEVIEHLINQQERVVVMQAFAQLSEKYQSLLRLWILEEYNQKEVAEITGMNYGTVRVEVHRGLDRLLTLYKKIEGRNEDA